MRIAFISDWFTEKMGYAENCLPKAMASLGHEVHVITSNVQTYFDSPIYKETYEPFIGPAIVSCGVKRIDGYTLYRLPHIIWNGRLRMQGLLEKLRAIRPQIVQTFDVVSWTSLEAAFAKAFLGYKLFLASHMHASVFADTIHRGKMGIKERLRWVTTTGFRGRLVSLLSEKSYPISADAAEIAVRFFGIQPHKVSVCSLGVDTDLFRPPSDKSSRRLRGQIRDRFEFAESDIVCIYTGRFSQGKDPLCLAKAIDILTKRDMPFRGLFVGDGSQSADIRAHQGCMVHPFVSIQELPPLYWAADIGVWPKQESTSQLDAAACGLPLILGDSVQVRERIDGNGLVYEEGNWHDLARKISVLRGSEKRHLMGERGSKRMRENFSWKCIAKQRIRDYKGALQHQKAQ